LTVLVGRSGPLRRRVVHGGMSRSTCRTRDGMPVTPIHMGLGIAAKAAGPRHISIVVFGLTQIALDIEVLWHLVRQEYPFHTFCHTYLGATAVACTLAVVGKPASQWIKRLWNKCAARCRDANLEVLEKTTWLASITGAVFGAYSHIALDSLYHPDIQPQQPWSDRNALQGIVTPSVVVPVSIGLGIIGVAWFILGERARRKADGSLKPIVTRNTAHDDRR